MEITWQGHSCLTIRSRDITLITDPYPNSIGYSMGKPRADIITISNDHPNHSHIGGIQGSPRVLKGPGEYEIAHYYISGIGVERGEHEGNRLTNTIFSLRVEGLTLCHLGDLTQALTPRQIESLRLTDVLFVPVGGGCVADVTQITQIVNLIDPRIVIPLHYAMEGINIELGSLEDFLVAFERTDVPKQSKLTVTSTNLPRELQIVVLQRT